VQAIIGGGHDASLRRGKRAAIGSPTSSLRALSVGSPLGPPDRPVLEASSRRGGFCARLNSGVPPHRAAAAAGFFFGFGGFPGARGTRSGENLLLNEPCVKPEGPPGGGGYVRTTTEDSSCVIRVPTKNRPRNQKLFPEGALLGRHQRGRTQRKKLTWLVRRGIERTDTASAWRVPCAQKARLGCASSDGPRRRKVFRIAQLAETTLGLSAPSAQGIIGNPETADDFTNEARPSSGSWVCSLQTARDVLCEARSLRRRSRLAVGVLLTEIGSFVDNKLRTDGTGDAVSARALRPGVEGKTSPVVIRGNTGFSRPRENGRALVSRGARSHNRRPFNGRRRTALVPLELARFVYLEAVSNQARPRPRP